MRALEAFAGGLQWKSETSGGLEEVWKDDDGRFRHFRAGELEYVRYGSRGQHVRPADSEEARRWFAHGVKAKDCRPFLLSRDLNPEGPEPGSTLCGGYEHWAHPVTGSEAIYFMVDVETGAEQRWDPKWLQELKQERVEGEPGAEGNGLDGQEAAKGRVINPDLERLRQVVLAKRAVDAAAGDETGKKGKEPGADKGSGDVVLPDLNKLRDQVRGMTQDGEGIRQPQWKSPDPGL